MNSSLGKSPGKGRPKGRDKEALKQKHRRELQEMKLQQDREKAKQQLSRLKQTGLVSAYEQFLRSICKNGLPEPNNIYEHAAQFVLKYEKKLRQKQLKKQQLQRGSLELKEGSKQLPNNETRVPSPTKSRLSQQK